jgi:hypothetical protein
LEQNQKVQKEEIHAVELVVMTEEVVDVMTEEVVVQGIVGVN